MPRTLLLFVALLPACSPSNEDLPNVPATQRDAGALTPGDPMLSPDAAALPATASLAPDGGAGTAPATPACAEAYALRAHAPAEPSRPYDVPATASTYACFSFAVPWQGKRHGLRIESLIDNARVLHHWQLYQVNTPNVEDGKVEACFCAHPDAQLVSGWAPGREDLTMPQGVGLKLPETSSGHFVLELHYNNAASSQGAVDQSGVRLCDTDKLRSEEAATHWLGTENITIPAGERATAFGTCMPKGTAHILNVWPHMHRLGRHLKTVIERADGSVETLVDEAFAFDYQRSNPRDLTVSAGDRLRTTCTFDGDATGPVHYGTGSSDEMCYNFVLA
ncbi:MAG: hypothetical protein RL385_238 [Pseudomonadota bacterium]|jgi:hypothetical protein